MDAAAGDRGPHVANAESGEVVGGEGLLGARLGCGQDGRCGEGQQSAKNSEGAQAGEGAGQRVPGGRAMPVQAQAGEGAV